MHAYLRIFGLSFVAILLASPSVLRAQTHQLLQIKFDQEDDVVRRAKMMTKLSRADFHDILEQVAAGDNTDALTTLQELVTDAQSCATALDAREKNPESHSNGFKQLQIAMRESLRRLDDLTVGLTSDEQTPFLTIRKKLDQLNRHLIHELFPHQALPPEPASEADDPPQNPEATQ